MADLVERGFDPWCGQNGSGSALEEWRKDIEQIRKKEQLRNTPLAQLEAKHDALKREHEVLQKENELLRTELGRVYTELDEMRAALKEDV